MSEGKVTSVDHGYDALRKRVFGFGKPQVRMGILEADGAEAKTEPDEVSKVEAGLTVIDVANWMEFGFTLTKRDGTTIEVPARSFIRAWFDDASPKMRADLVKMMRAVIKGERTKEDILELLGQKATGEIQARIAKGIDPPNAASTVARKGSSVPLIAGGQLRSSVSYDVKDE